MFKNGTWYKALLFTLVLTIGLGYLNINYYIDAPSGNNKAIDLVIARGYSVKRIGKELAKYDLIANPKLFILIQKLFFPRYLLRAGEYEIPPRATLRNVMEIINKGIVVVHKFTIPEGITTKEVIEKISLEKALIGGITREFKEGEFLSDTYHYTYGESRMAVLERVYNRSKTIVDELWEKRAANLPLANKQEALTLASIIEKETGIASERPRIAGVFINRLRKKMRLQADPTVIYAVTLGQYALTRAITLADLRIKSPYNTYINIGLPPTPIANSGKLALEAALNPMVTNELYFVANGKGGHNFSTALSIHNMHVINYRKGQ